jgi:hypothetical protein
MVTQDYLFIAVLICTLYLMFWTGGHSWRH